MGDTERRTDKSQTGGAPRERGGERQGRRDRETQAWRSEEGRIAGGTAWGGGEKEGEREGMSENGVDGTQAHRPKANGEGNIRV